MIPVEKIELIRDTAHDNITEIIGEFVALKKRGAQFIGLSPFNNERSPSFTIHPSKGIFKCFSSGKGGDVIKFLTEYNKWTFIEALKYLSKKFNIDIEDNNFLYTPVHKTKAPVKHPDFIHPDTMLETVGLYEDDLLYKYLIQKLNPNKVTKAFKDYYVGVKLGWTIFWLIDINTYVRSGKFIKYKSDGHRDKEFKAGWEHSKTKEYKQVYPDFNLVQCFFGEHLLSGNNKPVAVVESEKTAIIGSILLPKYIWLACGSKNGLGEVKCAVLKGRNVTLFPDLGCIEWKEIARQYSWNINESITKFATEEDIKNGLDLADYLLR